MLNLKSENQKINTFLPKMNKLKINEIENFYLKSMKNSSLIGLEYERLTLNLNDGKAAEYETVEKILKNFCSVMKWEEIYDNDTLIGLSDGKGTSISLEPGCQLEISLCPLNNISDIDLKLSAINSTLNKITKLYDVILLPYGINPFQTPDEIKLLDKTRYKIMNNYLPHCKDAELCTTMMRKTAGIQINIDYSSKKDCYLKLKFFNLISPFMAGLSSNSPFDNGTLSEYKSNRINTWLYTGSNRCNLFYEDIFSHKFKKYDNVFKNYIDNVLDVPMVFIERNNQIIPVNGLVTFREFINDGFRGHHALFEDYILHQSLCFPDVRLKQYIEIRNHDSNTPQFALMLCALYKGLSKCNFEHLLKKFDYLKLNKIQDYYKQVLKYGLDFEIKKNITGWDIITELFNLSKKMLNTKDRLYLKTLINILKYKKTQADIIQEYNIKNISDLIEILY